MLFERIHGRASQAQSTAVNVVKTLMQTVVIWSVFLAIIPAAIGWLELHLGLLPYRFDSTVTRFPAMVLFALAGSVGIWSGLTMAVTGRGTPVPMDCPNDLVIAGPYRFVRNPMVIAGLTQGIAVGVCMGSVPVILYSLLGAPVWISVVQPWEERDLVMRFGTPYEHYRRHVKCWLPRLTPYRP